VSAAMPSTSEVREAALCYIEKGVSVLALRHLEKRPVESQENFVSRPILPGQVNEIFSDGRNIGGFTGLNSGRLSVIDIDNVRQFQTTRKGWSRAESRRFDEIEAATPTQNTPSSRHEPGRRQIFFRTVEPLQTVNYNSTLGYEIRAQSCTANPHYCGLPPSLVSKNGQIGLYAWQNDITKTPILELPLSDIEFLKPQKFDVENFKTQTRPYGLPWKFYEILRFGKFEKYGYTPRANSKGKGKGGFAPSRSEAEISAVLCMARTGLSKSEILEAFEGMAHSATKFRQLPAHLRVSYIGKAYNDALAWWAKNPSDVDLFVRDHLQAVLQNSANARTTATANAVYRALLTIAQRANTLEIGASRRELAELAGLSQRTISSHIERLYAQGYIDKGKAGSTIYAATYILKRVSNLHQSVSGADFNGLGIFDTRKNDSKQDLFRPRGLGKNGLIVWETLKAQQHPIEADRLVELLPVKMSRRTVFRKLELARRAGLAVSESGRWIICGDDLDLAARKLNVSGAAAKQRLLHHHERLESRRNLAEQRERASAELKALLDSVGIVKAAEATGKDITTVSQWQTGKLYISKADREKIRQLTENRQ